MKLPASAEIVEFHDYVLAAPGQPARFKEGVWAAIEANHWHNGSLWEQEDLARRRNVPDSDIASNKRAIDAHNQKRNDAIEKIDEALLAVLDDITRMRKARQHSETAGAMIDRLSILSLKIKAMRAQTERGDVDQAHLEACTSKLNLLLQQRSDLAACLDRLLAEASRGETFFKVYRQFKMYNDPKLNPAVYGESGGSKNTKR
ncbi:MAG TPA: DUF4254 domain-containing protein [Burkholderiales bacterium]|nr:DUF4254 domain-containing protein [Burkholderiales bacterium]